MFGSHHDAPVAFPNSIRILDATVTRPTRSGDILGPHQRVDVMTALKALTIWPAWQHFEENDKGSIEAGKRDDRRAGRRWQGGLPEGGRKSVQKTMAEDKKRGAGSEKARWP